MTKLELSGQELQVIAMALKQMPYHMVAGLIENIMRQVEQQDNAAPTPDLSSESNFQQEPEQESQKDKSESRSN